MVHGRCRLGTEAWGPKASLAVDIFKVKDGKVVEHWDVMQEKVPTSATASGNPLPFVFLCASHHNEDDPSFPFFEGEYYERLKQWGFFSVAVMLTRQALKVSDKPIQCRRSKSPAFENRKGWGILICGCTNNERVGQPPDLDFQHTLRGRPTSLSARPELARTAYRWCSPAGA